MNFDRNTVIGFVILALLFFGFFYYNNQQQIALQKEKATKDSIARVTDSLQQLKQPKANPALAKTDSVRADSIDRLADSNSILKQIPGATEQLTLVENELMKVWFTNKGGQPKKVELKNYKGPDSSLVRLAATDFDKISYTISNNQNKTADISEHFFTGGEKASNPDGSQTITYKSQDGSSIVHEYIIRPVDSLRLRGTASSAPC